MDENETKINYFLILINVFMYSTAGKCSLYLCHSKKKYIYHYEWTGTEGKNINKTPNEQYYNVVQNYYF
jgi:hypothetical protein